MLSLRLTESIRASENKLSKKEKKRLAKIASEEFEVESCAQSDTNSEEKINKYLNIVNKKLRTLRKRMNKIEKYENCDKAELNADQITTIKKKSEVSALIKEFEDLHKQYTLFDEQEQKINENLKKSQEERLANEVKEQVENEKKLHSAQLQYLFKASYALNVLINTRKFAFSNAEINALNYVRNILLGNVEMIENQKSEGEIVLEKLYEASMDKCFEEVTYKDVNNLINLIINPPQVNKKENCQSLSFFSQDNIAVDFSEQQPQPHQQLIFTTSNNEEMSQENMNEVSISMSKINFMQPNECPDEEKQEEFKEEVELNELKENNISEEQEQEQEQELNVSTIEKELLDTENIEVNEETNATTELPTEETIATLSEEKKPSESSHHNSGYQGNQNNQYQKKRNYYKGGRGRRGYQNGQYNNRHNNGNGYKGSRNNGYYPHQNQNFASYYYNNRNVSYS
ncbi:hypothetical protein BCR32DRAFT_292333 [Anaeromyces robustus]|uniref:Caprin-1 dimerization domain-containing protein n=1 Tax=Anaeromyces robustus TaxID=1754192 RepID=A0A1Y1XC43_9FUNG|nr:hypothetical protein BCR32DRAFT_292333 [Anaeromyces robustus]|eukprot:ORX82944.1 hypothetical protein BCR32DRAFT_292333 [Anaeromyces robustus]